VQRKSSPDFVLAFGFLQDFADEVVSLTERNAFADQIIGGFRGEERRIFGFSAKIIVAVAGGFDRACRYGKHVRDLIVGGEEGFLVFLQIALVTARQTFQRREQRDERAGNATGLAANEFPSVGIFLLWHQAAASGIFVGKNKVRKFLRGEQDEVFGQPREMRVNANEREKIVE